MSNELSRIARDGSVVLYLYAFSVDIEEDQQRINTTVRPYYYRQCRYCMYVPLLVPHGIAIANASPISETDRFGERVQEAGHSTIQPFNHSTIQPSTIQPFNHATMQPCNHATMQPCNHSTMQPFNHSTIQPWLASLY